MNKLVLLTTGYPYGLSETFLETEIIFLAPKFGSIHIVSIGNINGNIRDIPKNVTIEQLKISKNTFKDILALRFLFYKKSIDEIKIIRKVYNKKLSPLLLKTIAISLSRANEIKSKLKLHIGDEKNIFLYSYWCNDAAIAISLIKQKSIKVLRMHGSDLYFYANKANYLPFRHLIANNCNMIYAISEDGKKYAVRKWGVDPKKIKVSSLGTLNEKKVKLKENKSPFHIVSCSNIVPIKRVDLIVEALASFKNTKIIWTHFGDGIDKSKLISKVNMLSSFITVNINGRISNKKILSFYEKESPNLFINVSSSEGIPVSIMEAMSFGIPVLATNVGGTSEIVDNKNGILLSKTPSINEIYEAIKLIYNLQNKEYLNMRKAAYKAWERDYNAKKNYSKFINNILSLTT